MKTRIPTPRGITAAKGSTPAPNFKPRNSGAIAKVGSLKAKEPPANKRSNQGVNKSLYWNK